jgi:3-hydroxy-9,10-secoandrosta-1,3,5(10)-triene-9,17-dione monooxygenase
LTSIRRSEAPTKEALYETARAMLPVIRERAVRCRAERKVPDETIAELKAAGLFRIVQPARYGGYEMSPNVMFDIQMILAEACMSTAWVYGLLAVHQFQLALFDDRAQNDIWGADQLALASSTYQPVGKVTRADGGFRLSGRWSFSSGSQHCNWILLGSIAPPATPDGAPAMMTFLLPRPDYQVLEGTWDTFGLQGTGSLDILVEDAFIPSYRTHSMVEGFEVVNQAGLKVNTAPLYRMPWGQQFARSVCSASVGALQGALNAFLDIASTRVSSATGAVMSTNTFVQAQVARVQSEIIEMQGTMHRGFDEMMAFLEKDGVIPMRERLRYRYEAATVARRCAELADGLMILVGSKNAISNSSPVVDAWRDIVAGRAHFANNPDPLAITVGGFYMGHPSPEMFC